MDKQLKSLHSRYNPSVEAERYVEKLNIKNGARYLILIEPGLGYIIPPLRRILPEAKIISLHAEIQTGNNDSVPHENRSDASWEPGSSVLIQDFLEKEIPDTEAGKIKIIEWRPAMEIYGKDYIKLFEEAAQFVKRADASYRTTVAFGRRWFKNFFRSLFIIKEYAMPFFFDSPVIIAGAGPSIKEHFNYLHRERAKFKLIAVSSVVPALRTNRIEPDITISSDGGGWALSHLIEYFRPMQKYNADGVQLLSAAMSAALPSQAEKYPVLALSDGSSWQELVLKGLCIPNIKLPQRGTVSAAALDLALSLTRGNVYLSGIDLTQKDIITHSKPYSFDRIDEENQNRFIPLYHRKYNRAKAIARGGSYFIYASWFNNQLKNYPSRLYSLAGNNAVFNKINIGFPNLPNIKNEGCFFKTIKTGNGKEAVDKGAGILLLALKDPAVSETVTTELSLLFNLEKEKTSAEIIKNEVLTLTERYTDHERHL